jgi:hypothetical protein
VCEHTFREFGRPLAMRTDNGVPFASCGLHGLSQLNVWWMRLGIQHQRMSPRPFPDRLPPLEYPGHFLVKRVTNAGTFRLKHKLLFIANALKQHPIGLEETDDGIWSIYFGTVLLAKVDERDMIIRD